VDAQGEVTAVRPVSFAMRNDATNLSLSITDLRAAKAIMGQITAAGAGASPGRVAPDGAAIAQDLELMLKAASAAFTQWRLAPPAAAPAIARVSAQFDLAAGQATAGAAQPLSGFSGVPGEFSTFVARRDAPADDRTLRVGGAIAPPRKIVNVAAIYPQEAKDAKVQGVVVIETLIDESGAVKEAWVLKSVPLLDGAALEAVKQWRFEPTLVNGVPTAVRCTITVNFTLAP